MKAIRFHKHGGPDVLKLEDVPEPECGPGEVLLEVKAASVNHLDIWLRRGLPGFEIPLPHIPGCDAAGVVRETGARVLLNPGSGCGSCEFCAAGNESMCVRYRIFGEHREGCYTELLAVPAENAIPIPDSMSFEEAASIPLVLLTAWRMLITRGRLRPGEDILILGAGAGVGTMCVQIAKLTGARVIATGGTEEKCDRLGELGADIVINYAKQDFAREVRKITQKRGVDVVVDYVGKDTWAGSLACVRRGGRLVTCGATTGHDPAEDLRHIFSRQLEVIGSTMGSRRELMEALRRVFAGKIKAVVDRVMPMSEAAEAHRRIESRGVFGKLVLTP